MGRTVRKQTKTKIKCDKVKLTSSRAKTAAKPSAKKAATAKPGKRKNRSVKAKRSGEPKIAGLAKRTKDVEQTVSEFKTAVNIARQQLERWLNTPESKKLRFPDEPGGRVVGNAAGLKILKILGKRRDKYTAEDV